MELNNLAELAKSVTDKMSPIAKESVGMTTNAFVVVSQMEAGTVCLNQTIKLITKSLPAGAGFLVGAIESKPIPRAVLRFSTAQLMMFGLLTLSGKIPENKRKYVKGAAACMALAGVRDLVENVGITALLEQLITPEIKEMTDSGQLDDLISTFDAAGSNTPKA